MDLELKKLLIESARDILIAVISALIAGGYISKIFKDTVSPLFRTYSDKKHDVHKLMRTAENRIYVVASIGDRFLETYENRLEQYMKKGVSLRFLIHTAPRYYELERYINNQDDCDDEKYEKARNATLKKLKALKDQFPNQVEVREFDSFLSASYIGIDIEEEIKTSKWLPHACIQIMIYQYGVETKKCPISYFSYKDNPPLFESTAECIAEMWDAGKKIDFE